MKKWTTIWIAASVLVVLSCDRKFEDPNFEGGSADYSRFVAVGNSLTAGFADGALYKSGQENSFPSMVATQLQSVGGASTFKQPLMADDFGGIPLVSPNVKLVLGYSTNCKGETGLGPVASTTNPANPANGASVAASGPYNNVGVPGAKVEHLLAPGYGDPANLTLGLANPYYVRFASSTNSTVLQDALLSNPTFFSLWIGNNDILGYATSGGEGGDPATPAGNFTAAYTALVAGLTANGAKGVCMNIPDVTSIPFFTTVPYNGANLEQSLATQLNQLFLFVADTFNAIAPGLGEQYRFNFQAGANAFLVEEPVSATNPLGIRQLKEGELILLSVDQDAMRCEGYGVFDQSKFDPANPASALAAISPLKDSDVLKASEIAKISDHVASYNATIKSVAESRGLAYADMNSVLASVKENGFTFDGVTFQTTYVTGGTFSLDGVHLTPRGYAIAANATIDAINLKYGGNIPKVSVTNYPGLAMP
ncbi:G-D-S-L family lipolytic protein [bacterium SCSIO 12741]|nr:G-D-S-L family lipolytic protein [bacterium SCSIO 12741]